MCLVFSECQLTHSGRRGDGETAGMTKSNPSFKTGGVKNFRPGKRRVRPPPRRFPALNANGQRATALVSPVKSESDKKSYKAIRLANGLTALLVSDPRTSPNDDDDDSECDSDDSESDSSESSSPDSEFESKLDTRYEDKAAACALCIRVGSYSDPPEVQGMAHFVEHMVFMGSKKYPVENEFDSFIRKKGGSDNAQTDCETTTFYFEVQENHLDEAMDRFAQFFVDPLMKQDSMKREKEAIESEFALALPSDGNRKEQLLSASLPVGHPGRTFMWGNRRSLSPPFGPPDNVLHDAAHRFRMKHYSGHRMCVAVQARLPLETLEKYVIATFGQIPNNDLPPDDFSKHEFSEETVTPEFHSLYYVKPSMQTTNLTLTWCMKSFHDEYRSKPHQYVAWIIGHEGTGSLLLYLQRRVWALGIYSGVSDGGIEHTSLLSLFSVSLILTEMGLKNVDKVMDAVFGYINLLKRDCPSERIFNELRRIEEINFRFRDEPQPCDNVEQLAENMQYLPPEHYMTGQDLYFDYNPEGIMYVIDHLSPEKVNIMVQAQSYPEPIVYDRVEEWFGTEYKRTDFDPETVQRWRNMVPDKEFCLPEENPFIPDDFTLIQPPPDILAQKQAKLENMNAENDPNDELKLELVYPTLLKKNNKMEVWFKPDYRFDLPCTHVILKFITPLETESPKTACLLDLWCKVLNQLLTEKLYAADVTGLGRSLCTEENGILLKLHGFSQTLPIIIDEITRMFKNYNETLTEELYNALKDVQTKAYTNAVMKPNKLVKDIRLSILMNSYQTNLEKLQALKDIKYEDLTGFGRQFLDKLYVKMLMQGNLLKEDSLNIAKTIENNLKWNGMSYEERPKVIINKLAIGERHCRISSFNHSDENSVITNYYQFGANDTKNGCIIELLMLIMEEPLFDTLRTKEQLGYNLFNILRFTGGILGFSITINTQSGKYCTSFVDERIEEFLKSFLRSVQKMSQDSFEQYKTALIKVKNGVDVELKDEVRRNWNEIISSEYQFDKILLEIECLKALKLEEVINWLEDAVRCGNRKNFRKLSIQIVGHKQAKEATQHVDKKVKLEEQMAVVLNNCNYSVKYVDIKTTTIQHITDIKSFKNTLEKYPEKASTLMVQKES